jgi:hypothetical protein
MKNELQNLLGKKIYVMNENNQQGTIGMQFLANRSPILVTGLIVVAM